MLREEGSGGVEEGSRVTCVENNSVRCVVQVCQLRLQHQMTFQYSLHLIGLFGFSFFHNGTSNLKLTVLRLNLLTSIRMEIQNL